jgi:lysophospholipase L1-like esterase
VLVTGVNDWKHLSPVRTPSRFRKDLAEFIENIRAEVGEDCHVFLPAIPGVHHAPRFHDPLRSFLIFLNDTFDAQKLACARSMKNVHFVGNPPEAEWTSRPEKFFCTQDRLHPSELGYTHWGERIATQIATATERGRAAVANARRVAAEAATNVSADVSSSASAPPVISAASQAEPNDSLEM